MKKTSILTLGEPIIVSQAPAGVHSWGPWQFPLMERLKDGRIHIQFHVEKDSVASYGKPVAHVVSIDDRWKSWERVEEDPTEGLLLPNGDHIRYKKRRSLDSLNLKLSEPLGSIVSYGNTRTFYPMNAVSREQAEWLFERRRTDEQQWKEEIARVNAPNRLLIEAEGVLAYPILWTMRVAPDQSLWGVNYEYRIDPKDHKIQFKMILYRSEDHGKTWNELSEIPYEGDPSVDPLWEVREGFTEPGITFLPDGTVFCVLRTTDGNGIGPMYWSRSKDNGLTWSKPVYYDDLGVWPNLLTLNCGVTLAAYGRKGLFVRATADPSGLEWEDRIAVVEPGEYQKDTCSYADMIAIDAYSALIVYSDFQASSTNGIPRKSIMVREIKAAFK